METIQLDITQTHKFVSQNDIDALASAAAKAKKTLLTGTGEGNDFLGWVNLPEEIDPLIISNIKEDVVRLAPKSDVFVVVGIGGSYLGARAVIEALQGELAPLVPGKYPLVAYAGHTLSEDYYHQLLKMLDNKDYSLAVISKSGTTTEPAVAFRMLRAHLEQKYGKAEAASRIIAVTDAQNGALHDIAIQEGYRHYVIPDNVGGRFSVLTPVGLLPIAMAGFDIDRLLDGAREMRNICINNTDLHENPALLYAIVRNILYQKGKKVEMLVNFDPNLKYVSEWWKQLYGESEGKDGKGLLPHSLNFTTDLHSMGQYVQEGERIMFETVMSIEHSREHASIPADEQNLDGINYLISMSLTEINHHAEHGTRIAHENGGVPILRLTLPQVDEETLGQLIYFFEFACGVSGYMLGVNPFNQPGVEAYKKNMFALLGKPGFENYELQ
ncbi:MAG: glucose-6-phosphate isomerase [Bacteroidales bacterium]|nr:glucose-6-phosphate isomerase [Bacteroidales bacterium]